MDNQTLEAKRSELDAINLEIASDRTHRLLRDASHRQSRDLRRLVLEREIAAADGDEYAEAVPISVAIGDEWHLLSSLGRETVVFCGDVGATNSSLLRFENSESVDFNGLSDDVETSPLAGRGLGLYGLFVVRNSKWKRSVVATMSELLPHFDSVWWNGFEHFVLRGKGGEVCCLARRVECIDIKEPIVSIRQRVNFWRSLA